MFPEQVYHACSRIALVEEIWYDFNCILKDQLLAENSVAIKVESARWATYKKNTDAVYGVAYGNLDSGIILRCREDPTFDMVHSARDPIGLLVILRTLCVQSNSYIYTDPLVGNIDAYSNFTNYKQRASSHSDFGEHLTDRYELVVCS